MANGSESAERVMADMVYVGLSRRVFALDRYSGELIWTWKAPKGSGFPSILLDGDRLIVAVNGYIYCLDLLYGQQVWDNPLKGFGFGVCSLCSVNGAISGGGGAAAQQQQIQQQQAAAAAVAASAATAAAAG